MSGKGTAYADIIREIFRRTYTEGMTEFTFVRDDIEKIPIKLGRKKLKNFGDVVYAFRHRRQLPKEITDTQPAGLYWLILGAGDGIYRFRLSKLAYIGPTPGLLVRKIPDATPEIIQHYALSDEQALLAKIRYNRLVDIFF